MTGPRLSGSISPEMAMPQYFLAVKWVKSHTALQKISTPTIVRKSSSVCHAVLGWGIGHFLS